jgi:DNA-binding transcriptional ArsR family regulator
MSGGPEALPEMTDPARESVSGYFRLLGEPFRLRLLQGLADGPRHVQRLVAMTGSSHANVSKHLRLLHEGGLLVRRKAGLNAYYELADPLVAALCQAVLSRQQDVLDARTASLASPAHLLPEGRPPSGLATQLSLAVAAHAAWKTRLRHAVELGRSEIDPATAAREDRCELGQWLVDGIPDTDRRSPHYATVRAIHADLHREVGRIMALALDGESADARSLLVPGSAFNAISADLVAALLAWQSEA